MLNSNYLVKILNMSYSMRIILIVALVSLSCLAAEVNEPNNIPKKKDANAVIITCKGMIDDGLYKSIVRRSEQAIEKGAEFLIFEIGTYGGRLDAADNISKYFINELSDQVEVIAYVQTEAISAGALISVSCEEIIMRENTTIGDCAPIIMGSKLEGVEREKAESFTRGLFERAAEANGYPKVLLRAMVSMQIEVFRVKNLQTEEYEFFEKENLPGDANSYALDNKELIDKDDEILILTASDALKYDLASKIVQNRDEALSYLEEKYEVIIDRPAEVLNPNWSEQMVRRLNSPAVVSILVMLALLGVYIELSTPGLGLPGLVAVICFVILVGSKYLIGLANWLEIAMFVTGILLILIEIFVIPGFGIAGITGILLILIGLMGMLIKNPPTKFPWPETPLDWQLFTEGVVGISAGFAMSIVLAWLSARFLPKFKFLSGLTLIPAQAKTGYEYEVSETHSPEEEERHIKIGDTGVVTTGLRPAGKAIFNDKIVDVVAQGQFIKKDEKVKIITIRGNRVIVSKV